MSVDRLPSISGTAVAQAVTGLPFSPGDVDMYVSQDQEALLALIAYLKEHFPDSNFHELQQYFNPFKSKLAESPISLVLRFSSLKMDVVISKGQVMDVVEMFDIEVAKAHFDGRTFNVPARLLPFAQDLLRTYVLDTGRTRVVSKLLNNMICFVNTLNGMSLNDIVNLNQRISCDVRYFWTYCMPRDLKVTLCQKVESFVGGIFAKEFDTLSQSAKSFLLGGLINNVRDLDTRMTGARGDAIDNVTTITFFLKLRADLLCSVLPKDDVSYDRPIASYNAMVGDVMRLIKYRGYGFTFDNAPVDELVYHKIFFRRFPCQLYLPQGTLLHSHITQFKLLKVNEHN